MRTEDLYEQRLLAISLNGYLASLSTIRLRRCLTAASPARLTGGSLCSPSNVCKFFVDTFQGHGGGVREEEEGL